MKNLKYLCILAIAVLISLTYADSLNYDFALDDNFRILQEPKVSDPGQDWKIVRQILATPTFPGDLYRPVTTLLYRLEFKLSSSTASLFHLLNLLLHIISCSFLFLILKRFTKSGEISFLAGCIFAVHPINTEVVSSIAGQAEMLSALFGLAGMYLLISQAKNYIFYSNLLFVLATFSKESGLVFFLLSFAYQILSSNKILKFNIFFSGLCLFLCLVSRALILKENFLISRPDIFLSENPLLSKDIGFAGRIIPVSQLIADYIRLFLLPINLKLDYSLGYEQFWNRVYSIDGLFSTILFLASFAAVFIKKINATFRAGLIWFFISLSLTCNLLSPIGVLMAERLMYVPVMGLCLSAAILLQYLCRTKLILNSIFSLLVFVLAYKSYFYGKIWRNDRLLFKKFAELAPDSPKAHYITGKEYLVIDKDYSQAEFHLRKSLELEPGRFGARRELANLYLQQQNYPKAEFWIRKSLEIIPEEPELKSLLEQLQKLKSS